MTLRDKQEGLSREEVLFNPSCYFAIEHPMTADSNTSVLAFLGYIQESKLFFFAVPLL